ncbi:CARNS1 [Symbiodinium sp. CCMP2456]|nr:CARNS1 [Symbiodinium sp. CCMP2456]
MARSVPEEESSQVGPGQDSQLMEELQRVASEAELRKKSEPPGKPSGKSLEGAAPGGITVLMSASMNAACPARLIGAEDDLERDDPRPEEEASTVVPSAASVRPKLQDLAQYRSRRFAEELEFVQCLASYVPARGAPNLYSRLTFRRSRMWLASQGFLRDTGFAHFLDYLSGPTQFVRVRSAGDCRQCALCATAQITYPASLAMLDLQFEDGSSEQQGAEGPSLAPQPTKTASAKPQTWHVDENPLVAYVGEDLYFCKSHEPTATFEMLRRIPSEALSRAGPEEQELRCKLLRGATIVFVSAGLPRKKFIFRKAAKMGVKAVIIDTPDSWAKSLVEEQVIAKFIPVDMGMDAESVFNSALAAIKELSADEATGPADGICTFCELGVPMAARLAEATGLPGPKPEAVDIEAARKVGFPSVLKPVGGFGSLGVQKVNNEAELLSVYREARYVTVSDNGPTHEPYFGETWGCMPSLLPREKVEDLRKMAEDSVKAIGFENGIFHVEFKYTSRGPRLIEVNARMGGGPIHKMHKHTFGVDLVVEQLFIAVGIPCNPCAADVPKKAVASACCNAPRGGCIPDRQMFEAFKQREGILSVTPLIKPGDRVFGPEEGMPTWIAEILVESDDGAAAARDFALAVEQQVIDAYSNVVKPYHG